MSAEASNEQSGNTDCSEFQLPAAQGARSVRIALVVIANLVLLITGGVFAQKYMDKRERAVSVLVLVPSNTPSPSSTGTIATDNSRVKPDQEADKTSSGDKSKNLRRGQGHKNPPKDNSAPVSDVPPETDPLPVDPLPVDPVNVTESDGGNADPGLSDEEQEAQAGVMHSKIRLIVGRHQGQLKSCYNRAAKFSTPTQPLEGRVGLQFTVLSEGRADNVRVVSNTSGSTVLGGCLVGLLKSWDFPSGSEPMDFIWPFEFQAAE